MRKLLSVLILMQFLTACAPATNIVSTATRAAIVAPATPTQTAASTPTVVPTATAELPTRIVPSPNGQYIAQLWHWGIYDNPSNRPTIDILNKQGSVLWQIPYRGEPVTFMPSPGLSIFGWSPDSADLYFDYVWAPDGGDYAFLWTGYDLQKIHIADGHIERILPGDDMTSFAFSADGTLLAYIWHKDALSFLYVRNLLTGVEKRSPVTTSPVDNLMVGDIHWSPDGKYLAYQTQSSDFRVQTIYLDIAQMKQKIVQEYRVEEMWFEGWTSDSKFRFYQYQKVVAIDPITSEIAVIGTPTVGP